MSLEPLRILLIEDNPVDAATFREFLVAYPGRKVTIEHFDNAADSLERFSATSFDCVLLDYSLPDDNGLELLRQLTAVQKDTPIIVITGQGNEAVAVETLKSGAQDYLTKSDISPQTLLRTIGNALERTQLNRQLAEKQQELEDFVAVSSHDLQAPLRHLKAYCARLKEQLGDSLTPPLEQTLDVIQRNVSQQERLIQDLRAYADIGRSQTPLVAVDMEAVIDQIELRLAEAIRENAAALQRAPLPTVTGAEQALVQLFQNLVANALKYRGTAPPRIAIEAQRRQDKWLISVSDNGIGIDPAQHERIFLPFRRLHTQDQYEGSGIGLATCKKIVDQHQGKIWVESTPGTGSIFHVTLAAAQAAEAKAEAAAKSLKILLAEDNKASQAITRAVLRKAGHQVETVTDGQQVLDRTSEEPFDLIVMDILMPVMDGLEAAKALRQRDGDTLYLPIIALTSYSHQTDRDRCLAAGIDDMISKPVTSGDLDTAIQRLCAV